LLAGTARPSRLGLTIARNQVNGILGGRIELVSAPGAGTPMTMTMTRLAPRSPSQQRHAAGHRSAREAASTPRAPALGRF
jgi:hypothetical protein